MEYVVEEVSVQSLTRNFNAFYAERLIQNNTRNNIVIIESDNNKTVIAPVNNNLIGRECVIIWYRSTTAPTVDANNRPTNITGRKIVLQKYDLADEGGCYIKELNLVLCTEATAVAATHPRGSMTYMDAIHDTMHEMSVSLETTPTIKLSANDPDNRYNKLYSMIGDISIEIPITHVYGEAILAITYIANGESKCYRVSLDDFFDSEKDVYELSELPITFVTTNRTRAVRYAKEYKRISQSEVDELLKRTEQKYAKDVAAVKTQYETDVSTKASEIKRLKEQVKTVTTEKDNAERLATELKTAIDTHNVMREKNIREKELDNKQHISDNNTTQSDNDRHISNAKRDTAEKEAKFKTAHLVLAAAIPTVTAVGLKLLDAYIKAKTSGSAASNLIPF